MPGAPRQINLWNAWGRTITKSGKHEVAFIAEPGKQLPGAQYISPYPEFLKGFSGPDKNRGAKRMTALRYFIENTTHQWLWSMTDDVFIDVEAIDEMIALLNEKYDSESEIVFIGHCCFYFRYFLQGGTGFIMSRAAARAFLPKALDWINAIQSWDDAETSKIREWLNLSVKDTASPLMYGHEITKNLNGESLPTCPNKFYENECGYGLYPLSNLFAHHSIYKPEQEMNMIIEAKRKNVSVYYHFNHMYMYFCKK